MSPLWEPTTTIDPTTIGEASMHFFKSFFQTCFKIFLSVFSVLVKGDSLAMENDGWWIAVCRQGCPFKKHCNTCWKVPLSMMETTLTSSLTSLVQSSVNNKVVSMQSRYYFRPKIRKSYHLLKEQQYRNPLHLVWSWIRRKESVRSIGTSDTWDLLQSFLASEIWLMISTFSCQFYH